MLILLSQCNYFYLKEEQDFLLAQTNQQVSKLDRFVFISEQSVRRYPALRNSLATFRGWTAFEEFPRALLELKSTGNVERCPVELGAGTCVGQEYFVPN